MSTIKITFTESTKVKFIEGEDAGELLKKMGDTYEFASDSIRITGLSDSGWPCVLPVGHCGYHKANPDDDPNKEIEWRDLKPESTDSKIINLRFRMNDALIVNLEKRISALERADILPVVEAIAEHTNIYRIKEVEDALAKYKSERKT